MKGTHTVVVERAKVKYTLAFKRNISFIRGNSGTGKTTLISMIRDYNAYETGQRLVPISKRCWDSAFTRTFACSSLNHLSGHFYNLVSSPTTTFQ